MVSVTFLSISIGPKKRTVIRTQKRGNKHLPGKDFPLGTKDSGSEEPALQLHRKGSESATKPGGNEVTANHRPKGQGHSVSDWPVWGRARE
jgi:hypothetical protein